MKKAFFAIAICVAGLASAQFAIPTVSPREKIEQQFSMSKITVDYGRPGVKGRKVFGDLVPYGKVWRAGANSSTKITFEQSINFGGKVVPAGTYGLFILPTANDWTVILNKDYQQWGAFDFDEKLNIVDVKVPVTKTIDRQEYFEISLDPVNERAAKMIFRWDYVQVVVPITEGKPETVNKIIDKLKEVKQIEKDAANTK